MECREITEGSTTFTAPVQDETTHFPPGSAPVFYNTKMEFNRDMTVLLTKIIQPADYLDAMAATGVRGLRIANEAGIPVTINDRDEQAVRIIKANAEKLGGSITVTCDDANRLMCTERFDSIDLDPFGTPVPFLDAASRAAKHYLFVTATDTAPLCGAHFKAGCRRYFATPRNTEYHAEVGLRMMMGTMARELVKYDRGMKPILSFAKSHYFRSHVRVLGRVSAADETMGQIGFVMQCPKCLYRAEQKGALYPKTHVCPYCGVESVPVGPLWMGPLQEKEILAEMLTVLPDMQFGTKRQMEKLLTFLLAEPETCTYYDYHIVSRNMKVSPPNMEELIASLNEAGYYTTRTHFCDTGIKTTASLPLIEEMIRLWNKENLQM
ncbi:MAG: tRNA (guanine(10)-N(2))-dimethyltransferase [Methanocorpusculum sp.]|uniref:tRNA (guanine(10)-N(2))-dimethyltransferase n=1 Tax=Methanocorpusculum sp. TaxID=2058474 RepID=UPI0027191BFB|nr:tRNA (guanine(10)-N(2))-dimethyltransferase [Methanocorpusculum sp.]MDO9522520.1 tRNA (guanine(10)-N(2))-dimethyltransferase [Methanocorpusculum sp.]